MKGKMLIVRNAATGPSVEDLSLIRSLFQRDMECRICRFGKPFDATQQSNQKIFTYPIELRENDYTHTGWISAVISVMDSIFQDYMPDIVVLCGYSMTCLAAGIGAYYMGCQVAAMEDCPLTAGNFDHFPMDKGLALLISLTDFHICKYEKSIQFLLSKEVPTFKVLRAGVHTI